MNRSMLPSSVEEAAVEIVVRETMGIVPLMEANVMVGSDEVYLGSSSLGAIDLIFFPLQYR